MGVREALLALLAAGPRHGYQLKTEFDDATASAWPLNVGQVYTTLQRLERDELVEADGESGDDGRQAYRLTAAGREELTRWLDEPVGQAVAGRDEVSMKLLVALATDVAPPLDLVSAQRSAAMATLQSLGGMRAAQPDADLAWLLHLDRLATQAEAEVRWLDLVEERLRRHGAEHRRRRLDARTDTEIEPTDAATKEHAP